jgi:hypothetical protein
LRKKKRGCCWCKTLPSILRRLTLQPGEFALLLEGLTVGDILDHVATQGRQEEQPKGVETGKEEVMGGEVDQEVTSRSCIHVRSGKQQQGEFVRSNWVAAHKEWAMDTSMQLVA